MRSAVVSSQRPSDWRVYNSALTRSEDTKQVLADGLYRAVMLEFAHAVVKFRGGRENLDNQAGIEQRIARFIEELRFAADHNGVRIGVHAGGVHTNAHVVHVCPAGAFAELLAKFSGQIQDDQIVACPSAPPMANISP